MFQHCRVDPGSSSSTAVKLVALGHFRDAPSAADQCKNLAGALASRTASRVLPPVARTRVPGPSRSASDASDLASAGCPAEAARAALAIA
jgi:hypothetical protein